MKKNIPFFMIFFATREKYVPQLTSTRTAHRLESLNYELEVLLPFCPMYWTLVIAYDGTISEVYKVIVALS